MKIITFLFENIIQLNPYVGLLAIFILTIHYYPLVFVKNDFIRDIQVLSNIYRFLLIRGIYSSKLPDYNKRLFKFKHELIDDNLIDYNKTLTFDDLYIKPYFYQISTHKISDNYIDEKQILHVLEEKTVLKQLVFVEGGAGSGKSNFLYYIGNLIINNNSVINSAFYVQAKEFEHYINTEDLELNKIERFLKYANSSLCSSIHYIFRKHRENIISHCEICRNFHNKCILLVDGFDELNNSDNATAVVNILRTFKEENKKLVIILTGRPGSLPYDNYDAFHPDYIYRICNLKFNQIKSLVKKNFKYVYPSDEYIKEYDEFIRRIETNNALFSLAVVPFLLVLMISIRSNNKELPENRDALIKEFIELAINKRLSSQDIGARCALYNILHKVAYDTVNNTLQKDSLLELISNEIRLAKTNKLNDSAAVVDYLRKSGLLIHDANDFVFTHRSIQDYLCAQYIFNQSNGIFSNIVKHDCIFEKNNIDILFFLGCLLHDSSYLFRLLISKRLYESCLTFLAWNQLRQDIIVNNDSIDLFWQVLNENNNIDFFIRSKLYLKLIALKNGQSYTDAPITKEEYEYISGDIDSRYVRFGEIVGLNIVQIESFFDQLNQEFSDEIGIYSPVSSHYKHECKHSDSIVKDIYGYKIARPSSDRFEIIKRKISENFINDIEKILKNIEYKFILHNKDEFLSLLLKDLVDTFSPNILLDKIKENEAHEDKTAYQHLRKLLINNDSHLRDRISREGFIDHKLITGIELSTQEQKIFDRYLYNKQTDANFSTTEINILVSASLYRLFISLLLLENVEEYEYSKLIYLKATIIQLANEKKLELWGRIIIQFTPRSINENQRLKRPHSFPIH